MLKMTCHECKCPSCANICPSHSKVTKSSPGPGGHRSHQSHQSSTKELKLASWKEASDCFGKIALLLSELQTEVRNRQSSLEESGKISWQS